MADIRPTPYVDLTFDGHQDETTPPARTLVDLPTIRIGEAAIDWAENQITNRSQDWYRMCQKFVRSSFNAPSGYASAGEQWDHAERRHLTSDPMVIPRAVPVFWETNSAADHVALSLGNGRCISTDVKRAGWPDVCNISDITNGWGAVLLGWTEDMNGVRVYETPIPPTPTTPHITEAIARNRAYARELRRIAHPALQDEVEGWRARLRHQREVLRSKEQT